MGIAKSFELAGQSFITQPGETGGTLLFMAPEQILYYKYVKPSADIYSVGVCMYYFLTGKYPFNYPTELDIIFKLAFNKAVKQPFQIILQEEPIPILEKKPDLPENLAKIIDCCLLKSPKKRYLNARKLKEAIGNI